MCIFITMFLFYSGPNRTIWTKRRIWLPWAPSKFLFAVYILGNEQTPLVGRESTEALVTELTVTNEGMKYISSCQEKAFLFIKKFSAELNL